MQLTAYTDYTLRALMYLAVNAHRHATIAEIARTYGISETHLTKVVHQLGITGDVETIRGRNGGIRLRRPAVSINLGAVVRRTEPDLDLVACFDDAGCCIIGDVCVLQGALREALAAFLAVLDRYSLADLITPRRQLAALLRIALPTHDDSPAPVGSTPSSPLDENPVERHGSCQPSGAVAGQDINGSGPPSASGPAQASSAGPALPSAASPAQASSAGAAQASSAGADSAATSAADHPVRDAHL